MPIDDNHQPLTGRDTPGSHALRAYRKDIPGQTYFITTRATEGAPRLTLDPKARIIIEALFWLRDQGRIRLHAFVVMPDHLHFAMTLEPGNTLARVMQTFKGWTSRQINATRASASTVWQTQYRDDAVRNYDAMWSRVNYIQENPARAGLVAKAENYPFPSASEAYHCRVDSW